MTEALPKRTLPPMLTTNEASRLDALHRYNILDTPPEAAFDELTQLAAQICKTPVALITFVDVDRQYFGSRFGADIIEAPLEAGFCPFVVQSKNTLIISDTLADSQFATNPVVVSKPGVRFYAGVPLITTDGYFLGTLCVLDYVPRQITLEQLNTLQILSRQVMTQLELRLTASRIAKIDAALLKVTQGVSAATGEAFFHALVRHFTEVLDVDYTYIGLVVDHEDEAIQTISACSHGQILDNFSYLLRDTPCREVIQQRKICCYERGVQALFPDAPLLAPLNIESYIAIPFFDSTGTPIGLLGVMNCKALTNVQLAESLLTVFALRIATELERQQTEENRSRILAQEQQARQIAETANQIKDQFLAVLSHELRTPLNPILGWANLLRSGSLNAAKTALALEAIERNAQLLVHLIEDLLDISRLIQGKFNLNVAPVDLAEVITGAIDTVHLAAQAKSIQISTFLEPNISQVAGDAVRLTQVVWNLISNAVKFTPSGGQVNIKLKQLDSHVQIQVCDTGEGISSDFLPHVFDYFRQESGATTRKFGGLGLGLAIVRQIVELHGGTVQASSSGQGQGATFTVKLPSLPKQLRLHQEISKPEPARNLQNVKVLVVDDIADMRDYIAFVLEQEEANVITSASAAEALTVFEQWKPDILISDIGMAEMDGYMLMQKVRSLTKEQGGNIPAIALTAYAGEINEQQALAAGFQRHLAKPVEPTELIATVFALLRHQHQQYQNY